ncbi:sialidase-1 [Hamadaea flava]|uniref:exo-alpha-sialidase n=1 Tax=Hamadaea flava TaxID=1742688 RepID=A0ABV8LLE3_9ACTN|nr:sialidase family protein [Hamadaea flava]MCP2323757.1 sialidase-1 [Hamadaea flava]
MHRPNIPRPMSGLVAVLIAAAACLTTAAPVQAATAIHTEKLLFDGGGSEVLNGITYHSFRIPSLIRTTQNTLLAFVEGRASANVDYGNINLVYKRSTDNGATWSSLREVVGAGQGTWGNPTAVVDRTTGTIFLFLSWNPEGVSENGATGTTKMNAWEHRKVYLSKSTDDGLTWTTPQDLTESLKPKTLNGKTWVWDAMGPGAGVQLTVGAHAGRLVIPALHRNIYSDDHGATWKYALITDPADGTVQDGTNEGTILELTDGRLYRNDRASDGLWNIAKRRWVTRGTIEGGFGAYAADSTLLDPRCEGSIIRYNLDDPTRIVFLNPPSTVTRTDMEFRISYDEGVTWPIWRKTSDAPLPAWSELGTANVQEGGYSSMAKTADYYVGALIEVNENADANSTSHRSIVFRKVNLPWLLNGQTEP